MMEEEKMKHIENHFEAGSNCQVFNGPNSGCVFAMPGASVTLHAAPPTESNDVGQGESMHEQPAADIHEPTGELFHFIHPSVDSQQERQIHKEIKRLVAQQGIQEICLYLKQLADEKRILLPKNAERAYNELVRMGMPNGEGFTLKTFTKYYKR